MKNTTKWVIVLAILSCAGLNAAEEKVRVASSDDLPRITYEAKDVPSRILNDEGAVLAIASEVKKDILSILDTYEIGDKGTVKAYLVDLRNIAILEGNYREALDYNREIRDMQDKPADKLTSGLSTAAMLEVIESGNAMGSDEFTEAFVKNYRSKVVNLPWGVVQDNIESSKGSMEMYSINLMMGLVQAQMDPGVAESGQLDFNAAAAIVRFRYMMDYVLPVKDAIVGVLADYIADNRVEKENIWEEREVDLSNVKGLSDVVVAIWDSGVDVEIFEPMGKVWINDAEIPGDGIDNDGNGWVDDIYGFAHNLLSNKDSGVLFDLPESVENRYDELVNMSKGMSDIRGDPSTVRRQTEFRQYMSTLQPEQVESFLLDLGYFGNYSHGTHVAGIAAKGKPCN